MAIKSSLHFAIKNFLHGRLSDEKLVYDFGFFGSLNFLSSKCGSKEELSVKPTKATKHLPPCKHLFVHCDEFMSLGKFQGSTLV